MVNRPWTYLPAEPATIAMRLDEIRRWRREHQPLGIPSAGSTFRNPPSDSAGRLIESVGWKGRTRGGATVSEKHANFVVNDRRGTASDVRALVDDVRAAVQESTGVGLEPEVVFLGDWTDWAAPAADDARHADDLADAGSEPAAEGERP